MAKNLKSRSLITGLIVGLAVLIMTPCLSARGKPPKPDPEPPSDPNPVIVANDNGVIVALNSDGSDRFSVADAGTDLAGPAWSPDGTQVAFFSSPGRQLTIASIDGSGSSPVVGVFWVNWWDTYPVAWGDVPANDGSSVEKIVFANRIEPDPLSLWTVNPDGTGLQLLRDIPDEAAMKPDWLPGGEQLAFVAFPVGDYNNQRLIVADVEVVNDSLQITSEMDITAFLADKGFEVLNYSQWANESAKFSFTSLDENSVQRISVVDLTNPELPLVYRVTDSPAGQSQTAPSWSADDSQLVFGATAHKKYKGGIYTISADGSGKPHYLGRGNRPSWWGGAQP